VAKKAAKHNKKAVAHKAPRKISPAKKTEGDDVWDNVVDGLMGGEEHAAKKPVHHAQKQVTKKVSKGHHSVAQTKLKSNMRN